MALSLCTACVSLSKEISQIIACGSPGQPHRTIRHQLPLQEFKLDDECPLCWLLGESNVKESYSEPLDNSLPLELKPIWELVGGCGLTNCTEGTQTRLKYLQVCGRSAEPKGCVKQSTPEHFSRTRPLPHFMVQLHIGQPRAAPAKSKRQQHVTDKDSEDATNLARIWLDQCLTSHERCRNNAFDRPVEEYMSKMLPSRMIDVDAGDDCSLVRLVNTDERPGTWLALSHCWGTDPEHTPIKTTKANLDAHLEAIEVKSLPRTFRDAVRLTRALGYRNLWIDSLCIIQDDPVDLQKELPLMGRIYESAVFVIAAGHARHCGDGCFSSLPAMHFPEPEIDSLPSLGSMAEDWCDVRQVDLSHESYRIEANVIDLPYVVDGEVKGFYSLRQPLRQNRWTNMPLKGIPLLARAWVMQEYALARRTLFFGEHSMIWSCLELRQDDRENILDLDRPSLKNWAPLMYEYTGMSLTYEPDRLKAIEGMVNVIESHTKRRHHAGIWLEDLPDCLLWKVCDGAGTRVIRDEKVPSWAWPSLHARIDFQLGSTEYWMRLENAYDRLDLEDGGNLRYHGPASTLPSCQLEFVRRANEDPFAAYLDKNFKGAARCRAYSVGSRYKEQIIILPRHKLDTPSTNSEPDLEAAGWGMLDVDSIPQAGTVFCLPLMRDPLVMSSGAGEIGMTRPEDAFHVLLVRIVKSVNEIKCCERVGIGVMAVLGHQWNPVEINIV